jgi:hypothetical protein
MVVALVCLANALPTSSEDGIPRPALRASMLKEASNSLLPPSIVQAQSMQVLVSAKQNIIDSDGDTHVSTDSTRIPRGKLGSTDHLKDDQFFLNIPFTDVEVHIIHLNIMFCLNDSIFFWVEIITPNLLTYPCFDHLV